MTDFDLMFNPAVRREQNRTYARQITEEGRYTVGLGYKNGIVVVSHNLRMADGCWKIREVHKKILAIGSGRASDIGKVTDMATFEADTLAFKYSDDDVIAKNLAQYHISEFVRQQFLNEPVCAILLLGSIDSQKNMFYKIIFDGKVIPCENFASIGGRLSDDFEYKNWIEENCKKKYAAGKSLEDAIIFGVDCIAKAIAANKRKEDGPFSYEEDLGGGADIEVALLDRTLGENKFAPIAKERDRAEFSPLKYEQLQKLLEGYLDRKNLQS